MQNQTGSPLFGRNIFDDAFRRFDEQVFFQALHERVRNKPYFEKYSGFKTTLLWLSYLFNFASALTAAYAVFWLSQNLTGLKVISWAVAAVFLFFLEKIKRKSSGEFWQAYFFHRQVASGWLALSLFCLGLSLASSAFGVREGTEDMGPGAELVAIDSTAQGYRERIASLEADNTRLQKQRNAQGEIYWPAQQEKARNKAIIADLQTRILELDKKLEGHNEKLSATYRKDLELTAWTLVCATIAMEILFELCIAWIWYYYYRSYIERRLATGAQGPVEDKMPPAAPKDTGLSGHPMQETNEPPPYPAPPKNGRMENPTDTTPPFKMPIGFYTEAQRMLQRELMGTTPGKKTDPPVHACTDLYRGKEGFQDTYTVLHEYQKGGKTRRTPYTRNQVLARIGQYEREVEEARQRNMGLEVIANRSQWLAYWTGKLNELLAKQRAAGAV